MTFIRTLVPALLLAMAPAVTRAELPTKKVLTLGVAKVVAEAAEAEAHRRGSTVVVVVVDDGGHLLVLHRLDDTQVASVEVGIGKARTAAIFRRPSKVFEDQIRDGRVAALALPGATPLQGGIPILNAGRVIGAIGVSGNTPQEDEDIAKAGAAAAEAAIKAAPKKWPSAPTRGGHGDRITRPGLYVPKNDSRAGASPIPPRPHAQTRTGKSASDASAKSGGSGIRSAG